MGRNEDIFEARLKHLQDKPGTPRSYQRPKTRQIVIQREAQRGEHSYVLPMLATVALVVGATAFSTILFLPDLPAGQIVASESYIGLSTQIVTE